MSRSPHVPAELRGRLFRGAAAVRAGLLTEDATRARATRRGVPLTTPLATAVRLAGCLPLDEGVAAVDRIVHAGIADLDDVRALAASARGTGCARARAACALADGLAGCPQDTRLRLLFLRAGLPPPVAQCAVRRDGCGTARPSSSARTAEC